MKQIVQDLRAGTTSLEEVPVPMVKSGHLLIRTHASLVSLGTERMLVEFGKANFLDKARQQPEKVKQVLEKIKADGLRPTIDAVFRKLGEPLPLGYCNAGEIVEIGDGVSEFQIGDRVISNGPHAEMVCVPKNLVAKIPGDIPYEEATFTVIGSIALQGMRLLNPTFGETVVVTGLGLIGLVASQLLLATGCNVIGFDFDPEKVRLAKSWGVQAFEAGEDTNPIEIVQNLTGEVGADGVLIAASAKSNDIISQAAGFCRKRGKIVLVGVVGLNIKRSDFYEKELSFQVSCSYGPGRYDESYETKGNDYPLPYVRWTQKRNFLAVLNSIATKRLNVAPLISGVVPLDEYKDIYDNIGHSKSIASVLKYKADVLATDSQVTLASKDFNNRKAVIGIIGAGNFTKATIVPNLKKLNANIKYIVSASGLSGTTTAKKYGIPVSTTNYQDVLKDHEVDTVLITTRHNSHAKLVLEALKMDKHVFVEKPLALTFSDLDAIETAHNNSKGTLTVGFNRRFSPFLIDAKKYLGTDNTPMNVIATMNAGFIPSEAWVHDLQLGGGRIIGEACHLIDLIVFLTGSKIRKIVMNAMGPNAKENTDNASILLQCQNGSQGVINYFANGSKAYSKERVEIFSQNRTIIIDNYRRSKYYGFKSSGLKTAQDKGHYNQLHLFLESLKGSTGPIIPFDQIMNTSRSTIAAVASLKEGGWIEVT